MEFPCSLGSCQCYNVVLDVATFEQMFLFLVELAVGVGQFL